jgi:acetyl-CoA carboxylase biotin carboxyl carrier protein
VLIEQIKELVQLMVDNDLSKIALRNGTEQIILRRSSAGGVTESVHVGPNGSDRALGSAPEPQRAAPREVESSVTSSESGEDGLTAIPSPIVGTFYASPNPDAPAFVEVGAALTPDTVVCIIEAMKVFNEIRAEVVGTLEKILVNNEQPVEYGQTLFLVRPTA